MNKEQFKLQIHHNRYVRSAIAGICKIILWTDLYIFAMWLILSVFARIEDSAATEALKSAATQSSSEGNAAGIVVVGFLILLCTVIYDWAIAYEIIDKVSQHKRIITLEDEYFGISPKVVTNTEKVSHKTNENNNNEARNNNSSNNYDDDDDML